MTMVDRVADEERLGQPVQQPVLVYFATAQNSLYQLRPWYAPLLALNAEHPIVLVFRDSRTASIVRAETSFDCLTVSTSGQLDEIVSLSDIRLALYVNLDPLDFDCLRFASMTHVYLGHGDSDKSVFVSNQVKAFDRYFVAGPAGIRRLQEQLAFYDAVDRCVVIGQPPLDSFTPAEPGPDQRPVVLYAPTWEGTDPSSSYSSLLTHGPALVDSILRSGRYSLVYRPHPLTGLEDSRFAAADAALRRTIEQADQRVDLSPTLEPACSGASVLITDVSAVAGFWLTTARPILITTPASGATVAENSLGAVLPALAAIDAGSAATIIDALRADPPLFDGLVVTHLGGFAHGEATRKFVETCGELIRLNDRKFRHRGNADDVDVDL